MNMLALMNAVERTRHQLDCAVSELLLQEQIDRTALTATLSTAEKVIDLLAHEVRNAHPLAPAEPAPSPEPAPRKRASGGTRAAAGQGEHRHKFNEAGACACGAKRQRAPRGQGERPSTEARTAPLPLGAARREPAFPGRGGDDDEFSGGTFGSSGTGDRR